MSVADEPPRGRRYAPDTDSGDQGSDDHEFAVPRRSAYSAFTPWSPTEDDDDPPTMILGRRFLLTDDQEPVYSAHTGAIGRRSAISPPTPSSAGWVSAPAITSAGTPPSPASPVDAKSPASPVDTASPASPVATNPPASPASPVDTEPPAAPVDTEPPVDAESPETEQPLVHPDATATPLYHPGGVASTALVSPADSPNADTNTAPEAATPQAPAGMPEFVTPTKSPFARPAEGEPEPYFDATPEPADDPEATRKLPAARRGPARAAEKESRRPTISKPVLIGLAAVAALLVVVLLIGYVAQRAVQTTTDPSSQPVATGPLVLPASIDDYTRDPSRPSSATPQAGGSQTVSGTYVRGGTPQFLVIASRPATDADSVMSELQATNIRQVAGGACGRTRERQQEACVIVQRGTAIVIVTEVDQTQDEMISLAQRVAQQVIS